MTNVTLKMYGHNTVIDFGKYKNYSVDQVLGINPQYLLWAHRNVDFFNLTDDALGDATLFVVGQNYGGLPDIDDELSHDPYFLTDD